MPGLIDEFAPRFTFNAFGGSMEFLKEIAFHRATRRVYARMVKEHFGAKDPRSMLVRMNLTAHIGPSSTTKQRPLNNLTRAVMGATAGALAGAIPTPSRLMMSLWVSVGAWSPGSLLRTPAASWPLNRNCWNIRTRLPALTVWRP